MGTLTVTDGGQAFIDAVGIVPGMIVGTQGQVACILEVGRDYNAEVVHLLGVDDSEELVRWGDPQHGTLVDDDAAVLDPVHFADDVRLLGTSPWVTSIAPLANDLEDLAADVVDVVGDGVELGSKK